METTVAELRLMLANWQAIAQEMQAKGAAFDDEYAYGALYGMQVCHSDIQRLIDQLSCQKVRTRAPQHVLRYSGKNSRSRKHAAGN